MNYFYSGLDQGLPAGLYSTYADTVESWQGATFNNLTAGTYTFTYIPIDDPSSRWRPRADVLTGSFTLDSSVVLPLPGSITNIDLLQPFYPSSVLNETGRFLGGTLRTDAPGATYGQNLTLDGSATNTIDQVGNAVTLTGTLSDAAPGVPGNITFANTGTGGAVTLASPATYTGQTTVAPAPR